VDRGQLSASDDLALARPEQRRVREVDELALVFEQDAARLLPPGSVSAAAMSSSLFHHSSATPS
jgi:hypothetical protein